MIVSVLLGGLGCSDMGSSDLVEEGLSGQRYDDEGFPVFECSPPPDEAVIFYSPTSSAILYYAWDRFDLVYGNLLASIPPLNGTSSHTRFFSDDGENLAYTADLGGVHLSSTGLAHPVEAQGEEWSAPYLSDDPVFSYYFYGVVLWGDPWPEKAIVSMGIEPEFNPTRLCLSRIRHGRLAGVFTHWTDPDYYSPTYDVAFPVSYVFDISTSWLHDSEGENSMSRNVDHRYAAISHTQSDVRNLSGASEYYSDDAPPDVLWSLDALPEDDE